jgi:hypothetical protein
MQKTKEFDSPSAWFHLGKFDKGIATTYSLKEGSGVYALSLPM